MLEISLYPNPLNFYFYFVPVIIISRHFGLSLIITLIFCIPFSSSTKFQTSKFYFTFTVTISTKLSAKAYSETLFKFKRITFNILLLVVYILMILSINTINSAGFSPLHFVVTLYETPASVIMTCVDHVLTKSRVIRIGYTSVSLIIWSISLLYQV